MKKIKLLATVVIAGSTVWQSVFSQPATTVISNQTATSAAVGNMTTASVDSNEVSDVAPTTNLSTSVTATNEQTSAPTGNNSETQNNEVRFQEIPLTTVIATLARQAGINFLLDPKIGYGQPDANNVIKTEPSVTIRWENITQEQALYALLDNYGLQLVMDPKTKIGKITIKDATAPPPLITHIYQLAYASVTNMSFNVATVLTDKRSKVVSDSRTSQLIVQATEKEQADVVELISKLDKPTRQVLIETRFIEISSTPQSSKGVDWTGTLQANNITFGNGIDSLVASTVNGAKTVTSTATSGGNIAINTSTGFSPGVGFLTANGLSAVLSFINSSSDAQVVSTPRIVTLDNQRAKIAVTRAFPIFQTTAGTQGSPGGSSITYSNVGIVLEVTPHISANNYISMQVNPSISTFYDTVTKTVAGVISQADEFDSRDIDTQVLIPNANTLVMGGMVKDNPNASYTKVPFLGDFPVIGWAFRSETKSMDKQNLLIFITPTIIKDTDFQPTVTDFMNSRPIKEQEPLDPNSRSESGKPYDWANPKNTDPTQFIINQKSTE